MESRHDPDPALTAIPGHVSDQENRTDSDEHRNLPEKIPGIVPDSAIVLLHMRILSHDVDRYLEGVLLASDRSVRFNGHVLHHCADLMLARIDISRSIHVEDGL